MREVTVGFLKVTVGFLAAAAAAFVAGFLLAAVIFSLTVLMFVVAAPSVPTLLLVIPLLFLPFAGAAAASAWLTRRWRISRPWLAWFLIGAGAFAALLALFVLTYQPN